MNALHRYALGTLVAGCLLPVLLAADSEKKEPAEHYITVGEVEVVLKAASSTSITLQSNQNANISRLLGGAPAKGKNQPKDTVLDLTADCKVRLLHLPPVLDDKGNKVFRPPEEINKLKGNSGMPGYEADTKDLKANQVVKITVVKAKNGLATEASKLYVKRIIIEKDPPAPKTADKKPDDKKKP